MQAERPTRAVTEAMTLPPQRLNLNVSRRFQNVTSMVSKRYFNGNSIYKREKLTAGSAGENEQSFSQSA